MAVNKSNSQASIVTRDNAELAKMTGNIYESVAVVGKRARQLSAEMKEELSNKLAEFASTVDNLEEIFENREQIENTKFYKKMPKPTNVAMDEFLEGKLYFRRNEEEEIA